FAGITNTPFSSLVDNPVMCADAGAGDGGAGDASTDAGGGDAKADANKPPPADAGAKDAAVPTPPPPPADDSGCGCRTPGHAPTSGAAAMLSMLAGLFAARRRRSRKA